MTLRLPLRRRHAYFADSESSFAFSTDVFFIYPTSLQIHQRAEAARLHVQCLAGHNTTKYVIRVSQRRRKRTCPPLCPRHHPHMTTPSRLSRPIRVERHAIAIPRTSREAGRSHYLQHLVACVITHDKPLVYTPLKTQDTRQHT